MQEATLEAKNVLLQDEFTNNETDKQIKKYFQTYSKAETHNLG